MMKKTLAFLTIIFSMNLVTAQTTGIPDPNFEQALISLGYDSGLQDGVVLTSNINTVTSLEVNNKNISDLTGIEDFTSLDSLSCTYNQLTSLDLSQNTYLSYLNCYNNQLTNLDVIQNASLTHLKCGLNQLSSLNISQNTALTSLACLNNQLTNLDVTQNIDMKTLGCGWNLLQNIDISQNTQLENFSCENNLINSLDVSSNLNLESIHAAHNQLTAIDISNNILLNSLGVYYNQISSLDFSQNPLMWSVVCFNNQLSEIDLSQHPLLTLLVCRENNLTCLNIKNGMNSNIEHLDATGNSNLTCIEVDNPIWSAPLGILIDPQTSFNTNCNNPCAVGIEKKYLSNLSIYPNPTKGSINIELGAILRDVKATLTNGLGQVIFTKEYTSTDFIRLDIDAPNGIYFLQLQTESGEVITKKIIKE